MNTLHKLLLAVSVMGLACATGCATEIVEEEETASGALKDYGTGSKLFSTTNPLYKAGLDGYEVLFTNPICAPQKNPPGVVSVSGKPITQKPENVYCTYDDAGVSGARADAPQKRLTEWIRDPATKEIFFTYLSFSNSTIAKELCEAVKTRGVNLTFILDAKTDTAKASELAACTGPGGIKPRFEKRGHVSGIGYAHNKLFVINPKGEHPRIVFSSGNMSSGIVLHHENWNFVTVPKNTHFAQAHLCLIEGTLDHATSGKEYRAFIDSCRKAIPVKEESDIRTFFVPGDGDRATKFLVDGVNQATQIDLAAHRFSMTALKQAVANRLKGSKRPLARLIVDDDMYWAMKDQQVGDNLPWEASNVTYLESLGLKPRYMETNHDSHLLHHNKYAVLTMGNFGVPSAVFTGAGNFTNDAFEKNLENFYYITMPDVVEKFKKQYEYVYTDLATSPDMMPTKNVSPVDQ
ncbi:MAG: hypothetical protein KBF88_05150 [Polyangiaceae bacterium]|nr:hypothetical protein [Polyangiaceae bacterium]